MANLIFVSIAPCNDGIDYMRERDLQMLTAGRNAGLFTSSNLDVVDEAREWGNAADEEGGDGTPITSVAGRVAVDAMEVVHVRYRHIATSDDVVVGHEDGCHGTQEYGVAAEESKELGGRGKDLPGDESPATNDGSKELTTADVDVLGAEGHEVVGCADGVG